MIRVDGVVDERERDLEESLRREVGAAQAADELPSAERLATLFESPPAARALIIELAGVALADEHLHDLELELLEQTARAVGIGPEVLDACLDYVQRAHQLIAEGQLLILDEDPSTALPGE
jgi:hypothetical protein